MGKHFISSGFIVILLLGWVAHPAIYQVHDSHQGATLLSASPAGDFYQAEIDVLNQPPNSFRVIKFSQCDFDAIFLSTLLSLRQAASTLPLECNEARKELLLSCLYPAHEFS
jgi:hypothetical protein